MLGGCSSNRCSLMSRFPFVSIAADVFVWSHGRRSMRNLGKPCWWYNRDNETIWRWRDARSGLHAAIGPFHSLPTTRCVRLLTVELDRLYFSTPTEGVARASGSWRRTMWTKCIVHLIMKSFKKCNFKVLDFFFKKNTRKYILCYTYLCRFWYKKRSCVIYT
jgi:hypothetical protein